MRRLQQAEKLAVLKIGRAFSLKIKVFSNLFNAGCRGGQPASSRQGCR